MISIRKAVRLVPDPLEQPEGAGIGRQDQGKCATGPVYLFVLLCESNDREFMQSEPLQFPAHGGELSFAAVDDDQVGQTDGDKRLLIANRRPSTDVVLALLRMTPLSALQSLSRIFLGILGRVRIGLARFEQDP